MNDVLGRLKNNMAKELYGTTLDEVKESGICISCKEPALEKCYSEAGRKEFYISGLCEICFDNMFEE